MRLHYRLEKLYPQDFERLVLAICRRILGEGVKGFSAGKDGGRDGAFYGTAAAFPSVNNPWDGHFVIQAKHAGKPGASCDDGGFFSNKSSTIKAETAKVKDLQQKGICDCYLLFTNRKCAAMLDEKIEAHIRAETGVAKVRLLALEWLEAYLDDHPDLVREFKLHQVIDETHNLPLEMLGDLFVGREADLAKLDAVQSGQPLAITQTVLGTGGIGKTRLVLEYAWRSAQAFRYRFFVNAATPERLQSGLADLVDDLDLPQTQDQNTNLRNVVQWLQNMDRWLLILDNVDDEAAQTAVLELAPLLKAKGKLLITSRRQDWPFGIAAYDLAKLTREASVALINRYLGLNEADGQQDDVARLADQMDGLPLGLELAAAYIKNRRISVARYLEDWERDKAKLLKYQDKRMNYPDSLMVAWERSLRLLSDEARILLRLLGQLAAAPIPRTMVDEQENVLDKCIQLLQVIEQVGEGDDLAAKVQEIVGQEQGLEIQTVLVELADISLIQLSRDSIVLHPLLIDILKVETPASYLEVALLWVATYAPHDGHDVRTWPKWEPLRPHAETLVWQADRGQIPQPTAALMNKLALFVESKGLYSEAEPLFRRALAIMEAQHAEDDPALAPYLNNLALLLRDTNRLAEAEPLLRRALVINETSYGAHHPSVAIDLNDLALLLESTNRLTEAEPLYVRAVQIMLDSYGADHPHYQTVKANYDLFLQKKGDGS